MKSSFISFVLAGLAGAVALFLFDGALQAVPGAGVRAVIRQEAPDVTLPGLAGQPGQMTYLATANTVSFIATQAAEYYNPARFLALEFLSALGVAFLLAGIYHGLGEKGLRKRLWLTLLMGLAATFAIHFPYLNWWGFSVAYTLGVTLKTLAGWLLVGFIQNYFIFKVR